MTDYKATPKQWAHVLSWSEDRDVSVNCDSACILELRARIEALEAAAHKPPSLKEHALKALDSISFASFEQNAVNTIRRALEQLDG
jgi:hypothetical protein